MRTLLHICCAPDATIPWPELAAEGREVVGFFYGANIHPDVELARRTEALDILARSLGMTYVSAGASAQDWIDATSGMEAEPEGGARCARCFSLQLDAAARYAAAEGFDQLCTTLTISPHKNVALINEIGDRSARAVGVEWIERVWRRRDGFKRSVARSRELGLYRQDYCGCVWSMASGGGVRAAG